MPYKCIDKPYIFAPNATINLLVKQKHKEPCVVFLQGSSARILILKITMLGIRSFAEIGPSERSLDHCYPQKGLK